MDFFINRNYKVFPCNQPLIIYSVLTQVKYYENSFFFYLSALCRELFLNSFSTSISLFWWMVMYIFLDPDKK